MTEYDSFRSQMTRAARIAGAAAISLVMLTVGASVLPGCSPAQSPSGPMSIAYEFDRTVARAVKLADHLCADVSIVKHDAVLAHRCAVGYREARDGLIAVESILDTWSEAKHGDLGCAAQSVLSGLMAIDDALSGAGVSVPSEITDGLKIAARLVAMAGPGACHAPVGDAGSEAG